MAQARLLQNQIHRHLLSSEANHIASSIINNAKLSPERAKTISERQQTDIPTEATYSAAALSLVLHSKSPLVPTFRSDVRIFSINNRDYYGGGADLTPSYLFDDDIVNFHTKYKTICEQNEQVSER